jgi:signal transduction histidine kinase
MLTKFHPDRLAVVDLLERLTQRETLRNFQSALRSANGQVKEVLLDANAFWENDKIVHLRWFIRDISRRKQLEREILAITERERHSFAMELHDGLGQQLSGIAYLSNVLRERLKQLSPTEASEAERISLLLKNAIEETRRLSRCLSPIQQEPEGLSNALNDLALHTRAIFDVACVFQSPKRILVEDMQTSTQLYRIAQEAVNNAVKHGRAERITLRLIQQKGQICLKIIDNGNGISALSPKRKGMGLRVMHYRAGLLKGALSVNRRKQGGTEVCCTAPFGIFKAK